MNVRELAHNDLGNIFGNPDGPGTPFILIEPGGGEYPVCGIYGDVSLLIDPTNGTAVQGRSISASYPMALLKEHTDKMPGKKWKVKIKDLHRKDHIFFIVDPPDHDNTIGLTRLRLGVNSSDK